MDEFEYVSSADPWIADQYVSVRVGAGSTGTMSSDSVEDTEYDPDDVWGGGRSNGSFTVLQSPDPLLATPAVPAGSLVVPPRAHASAAASGAPSASVHLGGGHEGHGAKAGSHGAEGHKDVEHGEAAAHHHEILEIRRGRLWLPPVLAHDWGRADRHRKVDWAELFSDLVLVAVALQMSSAVKYDFSWETLATVSTSYLLVFSSWTHMAAFVSRFPQSHLVYKGMTMIFFCGMLAMALFTDTWHELLRVRRGFTIGRIATVVSVAGLYLIYAAFLPRVRQFALRHMLALVPVIGLLIASMFVPQRWLVLVLWLASYLVEFFLSFFVFSRKVVSGHVVAVPVDIGHIAERFGLLIMIVLGESILGQVLADRLQTAKFLFHVVFGVTIAYTVHVVYFESQPFIASLHAMRRSRYAGRLFFQAHAVLSLCCILLGAGLKISLLHAEDSHANRLKETWLVGGCLTACLAVTMIIRMSHRGWRSELGYLRKSDPRFVIERCKKRMAIAQGLALSRQRRIHRRHFRSAVSPSSAGSPTNPEHHHGHHHGHHHAQHGHTEVHESQATTVQVEVAVEKPTVVEPVDSVWGPSPVAAVQPSVPASTAAAVPASADPSGTGSGGHGSSTGTGTGGSGAGVGAPLEVDLGSASNAEACRYLNSVSQSKMDLLQAIIRHDPVARRRLLWALRALLISMVISWTAIVASHLDSISALGFTGGLCILGLALITLDLFDVLNYSDEVHQS